VISGEASIPGEKAGGGKRPGRKLSALDSSEDAILSARSRPTGGCQADVAEMQKLDRAIDWTAAAAPRRRRGARPPPASSRLGDTNVKCRSCQVLEFNVVIIRACDSSSLWPTRGALNAA